VAGHVPAFMRAEQAVSDGYDELTHINQVMLNFFVRPDQDTRTLLRFQLVAEQARGVRSDGPAERRFIALLRDKGIVVDPTLAAFEAQFTQRDGEPNPSLVSVAEHLPVLVRRGLMQSESSPTAEQAAAWRESYASMARFVAALHRAGVTLVAGTDTDLPGLTMFRELELYVQAGIPAAEVLRIATWNAARVAGVADRAGSIARGKASDLVLVDGDPVRDIADLRRTKLVIKGASAYAPGALYEASGVRAFALPAVIERSALP
jgi:Amidohydrolase family